MRFKSRGATPGTDQLCTVDEIEERDCKAVVEIWCVQEGVCGWEKWAPMTVLCCFLLERRVRLLIT